jgi:hypothetical protein
MAEQTIEDITDQIEKNAWELLNTKLAAEGITLDDHERPAAGLGILVGMRATQEHYRNEMRKFLNG